MKSIPFFQVDAFSEKIFQGNPAAVCLFEEAVSADIMQAIAAEMNLSETAFLWPSTEKEQDYHIRFFTPTQEVDLCGHASLASAKVVFTQLDFQGSVLRFSAKHEQISTYYEGEEFILDFPQQPPTEKLLELPSEFWDALKVTNIRSMQYSPTAQMILLEMGEGNDLLVAQPDFGALQKVQFPFPLLGLILSSHDTDPLMRGDEFDFISRCFFPWAGIDEDPVTGAAHTVLGPFWAQKLHKDRLMAFQASSRGGILGLELKDASSRIFIRGQAQLVIKGQLFL